MKKENDILNGNISKQILIFFWPILFGTFFQQLYNTVDAITVGRFLGKQALASVGGTTGTLINLLVGFITGLASGATVVIAQFYGNKENDQVSKSVKTAMFLAMSSGLIVMVLGYFTSPLLLKITKVPSDIYDLSLSYMRIYFMGMIPSMIYNVGASVLRAIGDSKRPLYFLIVCCFVNIILDILNVRVFSMGVAGVAIATILSQLVSALLTLYVLSHTDDCYHYEIKDFSFDSQLLLNILKIGLPTGIQSVMYTVTNTATQTAINSFGTDTVAAYTAFGKVDSIFWMLSNSFGIAVMTIAGQNFGANNIMRVKETIKKGALMYTFGCLAISSSIFFFGDILLKLFSDDANVIKLATEMMKFLSPTWITFIFVEILSSTIRSCGDSLNPMLITGMGICIFRILWYIFYPINHFKDALLCYPLSWILTSSIFLIYYLRGTWLQKCINKRLTTIK